MGMNVTLPPELEEMMRRKVASGRYNSAPSSHARTPVHNAAVTATWQFAIFPSVPVLEWGHS